MKKHGVKGTLKLVKEWWWLISLIVGGIVLWGNLPMRVAKAEQQIEDLKGWAKEIQGYTLAMQQAPNHVASQGLREWDGTDETFWCCPVNDREASFAQQLWERCR